MTTASSCISWADFIVSFIQAAIAGGLPPNLKNFAQTTDGLKKFMDGKWLGGTTASEHADIIFQLATKPAVEPISVKLSFEQIELLRGDANDDKKMSLLMAKLMKLEEKRKKAAGKA